MFLVPSFHNFRHLLTIPRQVLHLSEFDRVVLSLHSIGSLIFVLMKHLKADCISTNVLYRVLHKHLPNSAKQILLLMFLKDNKNILSSLNIENCKNKRGYLFYKKCLSHILINTFSNAATGWLLLAGFF